jgi:hypothetical protein
MKKLAVGNVPACYKRFANLKRKQAEKVLELYINLSDEQKELVRTTYIETKKCGSGATNRTTKNDKCRILELRSDVGAHALWIRALGSMSRPELDARLSEVEDDADETLKRNAWASHYVLF